MSSNDLAISVRGLGKKYTLAHNSARPTSLREAIVRRLAHPFGEQRQEKETFWALSDVDFDIRKGEIVGIIGRNGAGKSTLLKILSQIVTPTTGTIDIYGRMASLLEVGTGFHPELTGRENIYLNGSILGMSRRDIARKFDEIVAFAEIEKFLDTPVKRYSSGMYVRLAFGVSAHLDPEIMIIDEVLAVGDAAFQQKCLGKMKDVSNAGRTILFVSHNMSAVTRLCPRAIYLQDGRVVADGPSSQVSSIYLQAGHDATASREWHDLESAPGNDVVRIRSARVCTDRGETSNAIDIRHRVGLELTFDVLKPGFVLVPNISLHNEEGNLLFIAHDVDPAWRGKKRERGRYVTTAWVPGNLLSEGQFSVNVAVSRLIPSVLMAHFDAAVSFQLIDSLDGDTARGDYVGHLPGLFRPLLAWSSDFTPLDGHEGHPDEATAGKVGHLA